MRRTDNKWITGITECQPRDDKRRQGRQRTRWRDELGSLAGVTWNRRAANTDEWRRLGEAEANDDDDDDDNDDDDDDDDSLCVAESYI